MAIFHIITPCSRVHNLEIMKQNIIKVKNNQEVLWHVCFDTKNTLEKDRNEFKETEDWIFTYEASTNFKPNPGKSQINFVLTHLELEIFKPGYIYVLDDDNILPDDFFEYPYDEKESLIYLFPQMLENKDVREPRPFIRYIDQAQLLVHSSIFDLYYPLDHDADGMVIQLMCEQRNHQLLEKPIVFYNRLRWINDIP